MLIFVPPGVGILLNAQLSAIVRDLRFSVDEV